MSGRASWSESECGLLLTNGKTHNEFGAAEKLGVRDRDVEQLQCMRYHIPYIVLRKHFQGKRVGVGPDAA